MTVWLSSFVLQLLRIRISNVTSANKVEDSLITYFVECPLNDLQPEFQSLTY